MPFSSGLRALTALLSVLAVLSVTAEAAAHAHHYGQSAFVTVGPAGVKVELDLSPGALVAGQVVRLLDTDGDGHISEEELRSYSDVLIRDVSVRIDGELVVLKLASRDVPEPSHLATGEDRLRLSFTAAVPALSPGPHHLLLRNTHRPVPSAHQAHALAGDATVRIGKQRRDAAQDELSADFEVDGPPAAPEERSAASPLLRLTLLLGAGALLAGLSLRRVARGSDPRGAPSRHG